MDTLDALLRPPAPTAERPLLGTTVLVVEDSRYTCEALRLMCLRSGARIRRADTLRAADRHLQTYHPTVIVVDLGLPDGSGADLIRRVDEAPPRVHVILGMSGDPDREAEAMAAGADGFLTKPVESLGHFQSAVLAHLPAELQPTGLRPIAADKITPDDIAFRDDMAHVADLLTDAADDATLTYVMQFLSGVALSAGDTELRRSVAGLEPRRGLGTLHTLRHMVGTRLKEASAL